MGQRKKRLKSDLDQLITMKDAVEKMHNILLEAATGKDPLVEKFLPEDELKVKEFFEKDISEQLIEISDKEKTYDLQQAVLDLT